MRSSSVRDCHPEVATLELDSVSGVDGSIYYQI